MEARYRYISWSEEAIHEARRLAQSALDRGEQELLGMDRATLTAAIRDLDRLTDRCEAGRYRGNLSSELRARVWPLIKEANSRLPKVRRRL